MENSSKVFEAEQAGFPAEITVVFEMLENADTGLWFVHSPSQLQTELKSIVKAATKIPVWIAWLKDGSVKKGELTQQIVREEAMELGLVDYKNMFCG